MPINPLVEEHYFAVDQYVEELGVGFVLSEAYVKFNKRRMMSKRNDRTIYQECREGDFYFEMINFFDLIVLTFYQKQEITQLVYKDLNEEVRKILMSSISSITDTEKLIIMHDACHKYIMDNIKSLKKGKIFVPVNSDVVNFRNN